jgi:protein AATF/BFR2
MGERYGGQVRGRQKIFDDDEEDEDVAEDEAGFDDEDEEEGEEEEEEEEEEDEDIQPPTRSTTSKSAKLDPIASLRDSRQKDVEKGKAIKRQKVCPSQS